MRNTSARTRTVAKLLAAAAGLAVIFALAGHSLAPGVAPWAWVLRCFVATAALLVAVTAGVAVAIPLRRLLLRKGATDPQWFWFKAEPPGLVALRQQQRAQPEGRR